MALGDKGESLGNAVGRSARYDEVEPGKSATDAEADCTESNLLFQGKASHWRGIGDIWLGTTHQHPLSGLADAIAKAEGAPSHEPWSLKGTLAVNQFSSRDDQNWGCVMRQARSGGKMFASQSAVPPCAGRSDAAGLAPELTAAQRRFLIGISALWVLLTGAASSVRLVMASSDGAPEVLPYIWIIFGPVLFLWGGLHVFGAERLWAASGTDPILPKAAKLIGIKWQKLAPTEARRHPLYGVSGWMLSLIGGLLLNVVVRAADFFVVMQPVNDFAPAWYRGLFNLTLVDLLVFSALYLGCFAAALRHAPIFPLLLCAVWALDVAALLAFGWHIQAANGVPPQISNGFEVLIRNNILKTLISCLLWLPYLQFSGRVQVTFYQRVRSTSR